MCNRSKVGLKYNSEARIGMKVHTSLRTMGRLWKPLCWKRLISSVMESVLYLEYCPHVIVAKNSCETGTFPPKCVHQLTKVSRRCEKEKLKMFLKQNHALAWVFSVLHAWPTSVILSTRCPERYRICVSRLPLSRTLVRLVHAMRSIVYGYHLRGILDTVLKLRIFSHCMTTRSRVERYGGMLCVAPVRYPGR
jgi:hypothetical protein